MTICTSAFGELELLTKDEPYTHGCGPDYGVINAESEKTVRLVDVRERADGTKFAVLDKAR